MRPRIRWVLNNDRRPENDVVCRCGKHINGAFARALRTRTVYCSAQCCDQDLRHWDELLLGQIARIIANHDRWRNERVVRTDRTDAPAKGKPPVSTV